MHVTNFTEQLALDFVASTADGLALIDRDLKYIAWNSSLSKITGVAADEAIGKKVFDLFPFLEALGEHDIHRRVFAGESVIVEPRPYNTPKGKTGYFQGHYWPWRNSAGEIVGLFMTIRDVGPSFNRLLFLSELSSELSKVTSAQDTLDITLEFIRRSTGAERGLVVMLTEDKQEIDVVALNNAGTAIEHRERLGINFDIPLTVAIRNNRVVFSPDEKDAQKYSYRHRDYVKDTGDVAAAAVPLIVENEIIGGIAVSYKKAQQFTDEDANYWIAASNLCAQSYARAIQFEKERTARAAAEAANQAKSRFLANVSHELRTPLTVVIGHAELMKNAVERAASTLPAELAARFRKYSERCFNQGVMLARILEDILDLTKIESGSITVKKESVDVTDWLEDVTAIAVQLTANKPVQVKLVQDPTTPKLFATDIVRAKQIVLNLVSNASKFTDSGEIVIHTSGAKSEDQKQMLIIRIQDTGTGIEQSRQKAIFGAFEKSRINKNERGGHGLGLAIATQLAGALGGSLTLLQSSENTGSTFELKLPDLELDQLNSPISSRDHLGSQSLKGKVVLLAEDDQVILDYLTELLKSAGATVLQAHDGSEAIEYALEEKPDVVILDIQMPIIDGFEAAAQLTESLPGTPLIALTAHGLPEHKQRAKKCGFKKLLVKPVDLNALADTILEYSSK